MKKLLIYTLDHNRKPKLIRQIKVTADFIGCGRGNYINLSEFRKLANDLEPTCTSIEILSL